MGDTPCQFESGHRHRDTLLVMRHFAQGDGDLMLEEYFSILVFLGVAMFIGVAPVALGFILGPRRPDPQKNAPYECGFEAFEDARMKFDVRYYLVAILFILFDLEILFLLPWAVALKSNIFGAVGFGGMLIFLTVLVIGFIYEWKKGALEWE